MDFSALGLEIVAQIAQIALTVVMLGAMGPAFWCMSFQMELMELTTKDSSKEHLSHLRHHLAKLMLVEG